MTHSCVQLDILKDKKGQKRKDRKDKKRLSSEEMTHSCVKSEV